MVHVFKHLDYPSLCQASLVDHRWHNIANDDLVLRTRAIQDNIIDVDHPEEEVIEYKRMLNYEHFFEFAFLPHKIVDIFGISPNGHYIVGPAGSAHRGYAFLWDKGHLFTYKKKGMRSSSHIVNNKRTVVIKLEEETSPRSSFGYWNVQKDVIDIIEDEQESKDMGHHCNNSVNYNNEYRSFNSQMIIKEENNLFFINFFTEQGNLQFRHELTD